MCQALKYFPPSQSSHQGSKEALAKIMLLLAERGKGKGLQTHEEKAQSASRTLRVCESSPVPLGLSLNGFFLISLIEQFHIPVAEQFLNRLWG